MIEQGPEYKASDQNRNDKKSDGRSCNQGENLMEMAFFLELGFGKVVDHHQVHADAVDIDIVVGGNRDGVVGFGLLEPLNIELIVLLTVKETFRQRIFSQ